MIWRATAQGDVDRWNPQMLTFMGKSGEEFDNCYFASSRKPTVLVSVRAGGELSRKVCPTGTRTRRLAPMGNRTGISLAASRFPTKARRSCTDTAYVRTSTIWSRRKQYSSSGSISYASLSRPSRPCSGAMTRKAGPLTSIGKPPNSLARVLRSSRTSAIRKPTILTTWTACFRRGHTLLRLANRTATIDRSIQSLRLGDCFLLEVIF
jgi:hypothetical protein